MSDDRKYRQRGYQDDNRDRPQTLRPATRQRRRQSPGARTGRARRRPAHLIRRRAQSAHDGLAPGGALLALRHDRRRRDHVAQQVPEVPGRSALVRSVREFRSGRHLRVRRQDPARVSPKDVANDCQHFSGRTTWERETTAAVSQNNNPKEPSRRQEGVRRSLQVLTAVTT